MAAGRPGRRCSICIHPKRAQIDADLADGHRQAAVAARFKISPDALSRHFRAHVVSTVTPGIPDVDRTAAQPGDALTTLLATQGKLVEVVNQCMRNRQTTAMVAAARELRQIIELIGRLTGAIDASGQLRQGQAGPVGALDARGRSARERLAEKINALTRHHQTDPAGAGGAS